MQDQPTPAIAPPAPPAAPAAPALPTLPPVVGVTVPGSNGAADVYVALRAQGRELANQLERLEDRRGELSQRLKEGLNATDQKGVEAQVADLDARIASVNKQIAASDAAIAQAAGVPGAIVEEKPPEPDRRGPPESVQIMSVVFIVLVLFPIAVGYARRLWKRAAAAPALMPPELGDRLARLEHAMESVAVEVERIGEGQRFVTKLFADAPRQMEQLPK